MRRKIIGLVYGLLLAFGLSSCGQKNTEITQFKTNVDNFCTNISTIDTAINSIDADAEDSSDQLLTQLDSLEKEFEQFAELDFPEEFDYLEPLADEASSYMTEAVNSYHDTYSNGSYNENIAEYAKENYSRAYKRVQIIIALLHGEDPADLGIAVKESE